MGDMTDKINAQLDDDQPAGQVRSDVLCEGCGSYGPRICTWCAEAKRNASAERKITLDEVTEMFGGSIPIEAAALLFDADGTKTVSQVRNEIYSMALKAACDFKVDIEDTSHNCITVTIRGYSAHRLKENYLEALLRGWSSLNQRVLDYTGPGSAHPLGPMSGTYQNGKRIV